MIGVKVWIWFALCDNNLLEIGVNYYANSLLGLQTQLKL